MVKTKLLMFLSKPMLPTAFPFNAQNSVILSVPVPRTSCLSLLLTKQVTSQQSYQFWDQSISRILTSQLLRYNTNTSPLDYFNSLLTVLWISTLASLEFILSTVFRAIISNGKSDQLTTLFKTFNGLLRKSRSSYKSLQRPLWSDHQSSSLPLCTLSPITYVKT